MATEAKIWGKNYSDALRYVGDKKQCARIDALAYENGPERGSRLLQMVSGGGLTLNVHPDRALDLGQVEVLGVPCAWMSPTSIAHPALVHADGTSFLRSFGGGLLATCGLDHFGPPCEDQGAHFPQHGRFGGIPAAVIRQEVTCDHLVIEGEIVQAAVHQERIRLRRRVTIPLGSTEIHLQDTVTNEGQHTQPHMILYHCNFGWPLLSEDAKVSVEHQKVEPLGEVAAQEAWDALGPPKRGQAERCWLHTLNKGHATILLENPQMRLKMSLDVDTSTLPGLCEWKMLSEGQYVLGLEPTNSLDLGGRVRAREHNKLVHLEPQQSVVYNLKWRFSRS